MYNLIQYDIWKLEHERRLQEKARLDAQTGPPSGSWRERTGHWCVKRGADLQMLGKRLTDSAAPQSAVNVRARADI